MYYKVFSCTSRSIILDCLVKVKTFEDTVDEVERLKKSKNFNIGQKIPSFIKSFSNNDLK